MALSKSPTVAEARGASCRALFDCVWIECDDMGLSLPPCCRGLLCRTISNSLDGQKARKSNSLKGKRPWAKSGIELVGMEVSFRGRREASSAPFGCTPGCTTESKITL